ncbi:hypothetical protein [Dyella sp. GSA-30]|uniref:hypothetical protein n=1 Tax=Dyella sp. GSA-30 TaxID=2994496 RepID=UPI0024924BE7|nr:hypothetical protein [Dyella sp. GSA-30]BDU21624.1 hypothetical protein DYGSA30_30810 [Dyella sp. GSA-30]
MQHDLSITRQSVHFPAGYRSGESTEDYQARLAQQLFQFSDPLLAALFQHQSEVEGMQIIGTTQTKHSGSHMLLTLLVRRALNLYRLPFREDRCYAESMRGVAHRQFLEINQVLTPRRIEDMTREVADLFAHTQCALAAAGLSQVRLRRSLNEPEPSDIAYGQREPQLLYGLVLASRRLGRPHIELEMDTLNSFSDDGGYEARPITLTLDIPACDVLYCANLLGTASDLSVRRADVESGEWVVINRAIDGVVTIPLTAVRVRDRDLEPYENYDDNAYCEDVLRRYSRTYLRSSAVADTRTFRGTSFRRKKSAGPWRSLMARLLRR